MPISASADIKKLRERLTRYERLLAKEKAEYGAYRDGAGKRYHVGPLYLLMGDLDGALKSFAWFEREFPDDIGEVWTGVAWALALHRAGQDAHANRKLRQSMLVRPTVFARIIGESWVELSVDPTMDGLDGDEAEFILAEYGTMWSAADLDWMLNLYRGEEFTDARARLTEIERQLRSEPRGEKRTKLVNELFALKRG